MHEASGVRWRAWTTSFLCVLARAAMSHVIILCCFHQRARLDLFYAVVYPKHCLNHFHFWTKIKHQYEQCSDTNCCGTNDVHDHYSFEAEHANTMFNVVQQIAYIHGAIYIIRDREEVHIYTSIEEEDYQLTFVTHTLLHKVVGLLSLTTSLLFLSSCSSLNFCSYIAHACI